MVDSDDLSILASELGRTDCPHDEYYYFHNDHLGTPQRITDQSGTIVWSANYRPFGEASITIDTVTNPFRFPGQYLDPETGLHYNYFRYYEPGIGRYLRVDPVYSLLPNLTKRFKTDLMVTELLSSSENYKYGGNCSTMKMDFYALYVGGYGLGAIFAFGGNILPGIAGSGSILFVSDDRGNFGFIRCYGAGLASGSGFLVGVQTSHLWGVRSICDLERGGFSWGIGAGYGAGAGIAWDVGKTGLNILTGGGRGKWGFTTNIFSKCKILWSHRKCSKKECRGQK